MRRVVEPFRASAPLPPWWSELFAASPAASIYLSEAWMGTWIETYGARFEGCWVRWTDAGTNAGACLLLRRAMRKSLVPLRTVFLNATGELPEHTPLAEFNAFLCTPGHEDAIAADLADMLREERWDRLVLCGYEEGGPIDRIARTLPSAFTRRESRPAPYADLGEIARTSVEACVSGNTRAQIRRSRKLYETSLGPLRLHAAASLDEALARFATMVDLHGAAWAARGEPGSFATPATMRFHQALVRRLWDANAVDLLHLSAGDADIGYLYNFKARGKVYAFQSGFAYAPDARLKPGLVTHACAMEHYARDGWREYDFLAGDARYKRSFASRARTLLWTTTYRDKRWMRAVVRAWQLKARLAPAEATA